MLPNALLSIYLKSEIFENGHMMANIGFIALILALAVSVFSLISCLISLRRGGQSLIASARVSYFTTFGLLSVSVIVLLNALLTHDFQIEYVASYSSRSTSLVYLISALWAGNDGSLLFWAWLLSLFATIFLLQNHRRTSGRLVPIAASIIMFVEAFFLLVLATTSNPFDKLAAIPPDGMGLNPMLENLGMTIHPPLLLAGYIGFTIPFALAMAGLLTKSFTDEWIISARKWTLLSWLLLGLGNIIGAWWAYVELGWGGYWAWDPVENAGLMPWLVATASFHSFILQIRRGLMRGWNVILITLTFNLAIFGTFLTRSGFLSSVHTYNQSNLAPFFLAFLAITFFGPLGLTYYYKEELNDGTRAISAVSRQFTFQLNNWLLLAITGIIFLGTVFPALSEMIRGVKIGVSASFFNRSVSPLFLTVILLVAICTVIGWRQRVSGRVLLRALLWPFLVAVVVTTILVVLGMGNWLAIGGLFLCLFVLNSIVITWSKEIGLAHQKGLSGVLKGIWGTLFANRQRYGSYIVHIAIVLIAIGVIGSSYYGEEVEAPLKPGDSLTIKDYTITYTGSVQTETLDKAIVTASLDVYRNGVFQGKLTPEKYFHRSFEQSVTEVAIRTSIAEDLYVILVGVEKDDSAIFKVLVNPLVVWIWIGGFMLALGGLFAFWPKRHEIPTKEAANIAKAKRGEIEDEIEERVRQLRRNRIMTCPKCGTALRENDIFCSQCGESLKYGGKND